MALWFYDPNGHYNYYMKHIMSIIWIPNKNQTCFTITYILSERLSSFDVYLRISNTEEDIRSTKLIKNVRLLSCNLIMEIIINELIAT